MVHTAQLWETRFWGWDRIGVPGLFSGDHTRQGSAFANDVCHDGTFRVTGSGHVVDVDGRTYFAASESAHVTNPCL
jgi:hypothetical protein